MKKLAVWFFVLFLLPLVGATQGCSDAGFCTMGAMKPDQPYNKRINLRLRSMDVSFYRGTTTLTPIVKSVTADFSFSLNDRNSFQVKLPYQWVDGRLAHTGGLGDISLCFTRNVYASDRFDINFSLGSKIPTNQSDLHDADGRHLPMYYQTSLGTYDLISGISLINRKWLFATGIQVPLNQNRNQFDWHNAEWQLTDLNERAYVQQYANATSLRRGVDVMLRAERNFRLARFNCSFGLLPIYRIVADEYTNFKGIRSNANAAGDIGKGLALSWIATAGYNFNVKSGIKLLVGHKITQRNFSPDGLTRELVMSFTYSYRF
ncbi:MAG: hypothetical protein U0V64_02125 [Cyclobacteriaceae bacterium]